MYVVEEADGASDLARARLSDGAVVRIVRTRRREERWPYWSPIARRVVFQARPYGPDLRTDLHLWDPATGQETALTPTPRRDERWPEWSPTTPELAYAFRQGWQASGIALLDVNTHAVRLVAQAGPRDFFFRPSFTPDGRRMVAQRRVRDGALSHLYVLAPGRAPRPRTTGEVFDTKPFPTPDGRSVIFTRRAGQQEPGDLARIGLEGGPVELFASLPGADDHSAKHSPTRDEVVFVSDRDGSGDIFLMELPDGEPRNLTRSPEVEEATPIWSPDGEWLVILAEPRQREPGDSKHADARLLVIDREGRLRFETPGLMADWMPAWP